MIRSEELVDLSVPRLFESDPITPGTGVETVVASALGAFNACDAWFRVPSGWSSDLILRVYARLNDARVLLKEVDLADTHRTLASGFLSGIAISVRGRPVTGYEFAVQPRTALSATGRFMLQAWAGSDGPRVLGGVTTATQPAAEESLIAVKSGGLPVLVAGDSSGRLLVAGAGTAGNPQGGLLSVQGSAAAGPTYAIASPVTVKPSVATANTTTNIMTLRSSSTKRVEIRRIILSYHGVAAAAAADGRIQVLRTSNAPTGGNALTPIRFDSGQAAAAAAALVVNPTAITLAATEMLLSVAVRCDSKDRLILRPDALGQPIALRTTQETLLIRFTNDTVAASQTFGIHATVHFIEI